MKILVTGGAGFIGSNLIKKLFIEYKHEVVSLDNYNSGLKENHINGVKYIKDDIENIDKIKGDFNICFHLAALSRIQPVIIEPL